MLDRVFGRMSLGSRRGGSSALCWPMANRRLTVPRSSRAGALHWPDAGIILNEQHNRQAPIMRFKPELVGTELRIDAALPDTQRGRDAAIMVKNGTFTGLSIEFRSESEGRSAGTRMIRRARLSGAALVDSPSHKSSVEVRGKAGRRARVWL